MRKSSHNLHKKDEDRISQLSDDILISIISRLTIGEATVTSILSTRWQYLHTYVTHLDFFPPSNFPGRTSFRNYPDTVIDIVLDAHRGGRVRVLKVGTNKARLDRCLEFALAKEAEIIDIRNHDRPHDCFLGLASNSNIINRLLPSGLKCLEQLSLSNVFVNDLDFELLLTNSLALQSLSIKCSYRHLKNVRIIGHPKLKHLDLSDGYELESIEIRDAINLVSLKLHQPRRGCALQLSNIPNFIRLDYYEYHDDLGNKLFARMPSCIRDQLQSLILSTNLFPTMEDKPSFEFPNIKHLELSLNMSEEPNCVYLVHPLMEACRSLEKLKIKLTVRRSRVKMSGLKEVEASKIYRELTSYIDRRSASKLSRNLKEVEMMGYLGSRSELELASYIIKNAASLQELIVVTAFDLRREEHRVEFDRARRDFHRIITSSEIIFYLFLLEN